MNLRRTLAPFVVSLAAATTALSPARADDAPAPAPEQGRAKEHLDRGTVFYNMQDWPAAIREYKEAYTLDPRPATLFSIAQAQRLGGECPTAILSYKAFLRDASPTQAAAAEALIHACERDIADKEKKKAEAEAAKPSPAPASEDGVQSAAVGPAAQPPPAPTSATTTPPPPAPDKKPAAPSPWYADALGDVAVVSGAAVLGIGSYFVAKGNSEMSASASAPTYKAYGEAVSAAKPKQTGGVAGLVAGSALIGLGVVRYVIVTRRARVPEAAVAVTNRGAVVTWAGRF